MLPMPPEKETLLKEYLTELAQLMREHTETEKLKDFESMEVEVRDQILELVAPVIGEFFLQKEGKNAQETSER
jgi:hypothetical protein